MYTCNLCNIRQMSSRITDSEVCVLKTRKSIYVIKIILEFLINYIVLHETNIFWNLIYMRNVTSQMLSNNFLHHIHGELEKILNMNNIIFFYHFTAYHMYCLNSNGNKSVRRTLDETHVICIRKREVRRYGVRHRRTSPWDRISIESNSVHEHERSTKFVL